MVLNGFLAKNPTDLLLDFLNELLAEKEGRIESIKYLPNENLPIGIGGRRGIFDIYCINEKGEHFIVEMQKAAQKYFKDRMVFYSTFPIQEQARNQGRDWDFRLNRIYTNRHFYQWQRAHHSKAIKRFF